MQDEEVTEAQLLESIGKSEDSDGNIQIDKEGE
jgi:hypothetical protein